MTLDDAKARIKELGVLLACSRGDYYKDVLRERAALLKKVAEFEKEAGK